MTDHGGVRRSEMETSDPERAREWMTQAYGGHVPRLSGNREGFRMRVASVGTERFRVDEMVHTMELDALTEPYDAVMITNPRAGRYWAQEPRRDFRLGPGGLLLLDARHELHAGWSPIDQQIVRLEGGPVAREVEGLTGVPASQVRFEMSEPRTESHARYWSAVVARAAGVLAVDEVADTPLVQAELFHMLTVAMLTAFPNTALDAVDDPLVRGAGRAEPASVRRAVEFMDAHAREDIGISRIAEASRLGVRGLQAAFRRHRGQTPLEYLRRVRLEGAHRDLRAADPTRGDTVAAIAARWGFAHPGRFSVAYREAFGCHPGETLRG